MTDVGRHPRIKLMTLSEVEGVSGYVGNFKVKVRQKARFVDTSCTACGECTVVCPVTKPDEYQGGFSTRKAIFKPFPQAIPSAYLINMQDCLGNNPIACNKCAERCDKRCIDLDMQDRVVELEVGTIIVATGMDTYDPTEIDEYGYTRYENVVTSMELERLLDAGGPSEGHLVRPSDGKQPKRIAFLQCVGSRSSKRGNSYCSNVCCMNTIKDSLLLKEHYRNIEVFVYYIDIRSFGKGFEDLFNRSKQVGTVYIRGLPDSIVEDQQTKNLQFRVENTSTGRVEDGEFDMVVLAVGLVPRHDGENLRQALALSVTSDGFLAESHPKLRPVDAVTRGVFLAGCVESPKDIKDSVTQAGAAAARASIFLSRGSVEAEAAVATVDRSKCTFCELCVKVCPYGAITASRAQKIAATVNEAMCAGCGTCAAECAFGAISIRHFDDGQYLTQIEAALADNPQDKVVVFACNWCSYGASDLAGLSRLQYPSSARVIRTMCSGRVDEKFVLHAFKLGAPIVLVSGCHYADCHYINANRSTVRRVDRLWSRLERLGIRPERLQLEWMSAAEGQKFARVMADLEKMRAAVTPAEIAATKKALEEQDSKKKKPVAVGG